MNPLVSPFVGPSGGGAGGAASSVPASGVTGIAEGEIVRGDAGTGIQGSLVSIDDDGVIVVPSGSGITASDGDTWLTFGGGATGTGNKLMAMYIDTVALSDTGLLSWKDVTDANAGASDAGLARSAIGVIRATDGSTGIGKILNARLVEANTAGSGAPNVLTDVESHTVLTNEGATAENYHTLPTAVAGLQFTFIVQDADGIRITAAAGGTIRPIAGTAASATGGFIRCATQGAFITLLAINATEWISIGSAGVWTIDI